MTAKKDDRKIPGPKPGTTWRWRNCRVRRELAAEWDRQEIDGLEPWIDKQLVAKLAENNGEAVQKQTEEERLNAELEGLRAEYDRRRDAGEFKEA